jgi:hypothetical protein
MVYETEVSVRRTIGKPSTRQRQRCLAAKVLRAYLRSVPASQRRGLLDEIHACAQLYLQSLRMVWTPQGLWRRLVRSIATRRINEFLGKLRAECESGPCTAPSPAATGGMCAEPHPEQGGQAGD